MRVLGIGEYNSLGDMYLRLSRAGHETRVYVDKIEGHDVFEGLVDRTDDWKKELSWIRQAGKDGIIVFELSRHGALQDQLRADGYNVVGGCAYGDRLEGERDFGQSELKNAGVNIAGYYEFSAIEEAVEFIRARPARYVLKFDGVTRTSMSNYVGESNDGTDVIAQLKQEKLNPADIEPSFILMDYLDGVEVGVGAYFNGEEFLAPVVLDWEHKKFFPGDLGELTGEMGTLVTYRNSKKIFSSTLAKMEPTLRKQGYCGYINLNTIVDDEGIWPLEFTCRFGYPGFAICDALHIDGWDTVLSRMVRKESRDFRTRDGYAVGVVLTVPPFPYEEGYEQLSKGKPIRFRDATETDVNQLHYAEVAYRNGQLVTSGSIGYLMVATGIGLTVPAAQEDAYRIARKVIVPNLRYRNDIGDKFLRRDQAILQRLGYLP